MKHQKKIRHKRICTACFGRRLVYSPFEGGLIECYICKERKESCV